MSRPTFHVRPRYRCAVCDRGVQVTVWDRLRVHGPRNAPCEGSGQVPRRDARVDP
jgi:hypothetical protein